MLGEPSSALMASLGMVICCVAAVPEQLSCPNSVPGKPPSATDLVAATIVTSTTSVRPHLAMGFSGQPRWNTVSAAGSYLMVDRFSMTVRRSVPVAAFIESYMPSMPPEYWKRIALPAGIGFELGGNRYVERSGPTLPIMTGP